MAKIRSSFKTFRASLTSNLKSAIVKDMVQEVELLQSIQSHPHASEYLCKSQQPRAADCAYQVAIACLEGFGRPRDDKESLKWMKIAAEWGSPIAQAEILPLTLALGVQCLDKDGGSGDPTVQWAIDAVANQGHPGAVNALWQVNEKKCTESVLKYRANRTKKIEAAFERRTGEKWEEVCWHEDWKAKLRKLHRDMSRGFIAVMKAAQDGNWTLLHYAAALSPEGRLLAIPALERVKFLVEKLDIDVRQLNADNATPLDLAMVRGNTRIVNYLLNWHERWKPRPFPGSCPLQNIGYLPDWSIADFVDRILTMAPDTSIDERLTSTRRTPLLNTILTEEPLLPPAREAAIVALLAHGANPLLTALDSSPVSALLTAVTQVQPPLVGAMLQAIKKFGHGTVQPNLANELARAFLRLMQTPRSVSLATGLNPSSSAFSQLTGISGYSLSLGAIIKVMLDQGMSSELRNVCRGMQHDALGLASYYGRDEAMQAILKGSEGPGPLRKHKMLGLSQVGSIDGLATAIECGFVEAVDLLLPHMAKRPELNDHSLILTGAVHHQPALVQQVFGHFERAGRCPEVLEFQDQWGATILDLALEYGYFDLARFLLAKGAKYDVYRLKGDHTIDEGRQSTLASVLPRIQPIKLLMELTPKPRLVVTSSGFNVFHVLAADEKLIGTTIGRAEFLQVLEYFYALDPTLIHARGGAEGFTPLHVVSLHYSETVGSFLHTHGADVNATSTKGHTPLDLLHFHDDGDRGVEEHLTVDYRGANGVPRKGVAICDFAMAGPVYWKLEAKLAARLKELYKTWGAKRGLMTMMRKLGLQTDPMAAFWSGGITAYYEGEDGKEHARHFP
ncbi:ankyrin [Sarocladium strictum]